PGDGRDAHLAREPDVRLVLGNGPDRAGQVLGGHGKPLPIRGKTEVADLRRVPPERSFALAGRDVPEDDVLVAAAGGEPLAVGRERQRADGVAVASEHLLDFATGEIHQEDDATGVLPAALEVVAADGERLAVG